MSSILGEMLDRTRKQNAGGWKRALFLFLGLILVINVFIRPHHVEYGIDGYTGFWAVFGLGVTVVMVVVMKKLIQPILVRPEENDDLDN